MAIYEKLYDTAKKSYSDNIYLDEIVGEIVSDIKNVVNVIGDVDVFQKFTPQSDIDITFTKDENLSALVNLYIIDTRKIKDISDYIELAKKLENYKNNYKLFCNRMFIVVYESIIDENISKQIKILLNKSEGEICYQKICDVVDDEFFLPNIKKYIKSLFFTENNDLLKKLIDEKNSLPYDFFLDSIAGSKYVRKLILYLLGILFYTMVVFLAIFMIPIMIIGEVFFLIHNESFLGLIGVLVVAILIFLMKMATCGLRFLTRKIRNINYMKYTIYEVDNYKKLTYKHISYEDVDYSVESGILYFMHDKFNDLVYTADKCMCIKCNYFIKDSSIKITHIYSITVYDYDV